MARHRRPRRDLTAVAAWVGLILLLAAFWAAVTYVALHH